MPAVIPDGVHVAPEILRLIYHGAGAAANDSHDRQSFARREPPAIRR